jgi:hypothetical protein
MRGLLSTTCWATAGCNSGSPLPCLGRRLVLSGIITQPAAQKYRDFRNQLAPKIWSLPLTLQPSRQYHVYRRRALAQSLPGGVCLLLKAIGASEGWRNAIRYHTRSLSQPATPIPPLAGFSLPPKALLQTQATCQSPKIANWPRAVMPEVTPCVILLSKKPNFMQFYKIVPASPSPPGWGPRGRGAAAMLQKSQFYAIL